MLASLVTCGSSGQSGAAVKRRHASSAEVKGAFMPRTIVRNRNNVKPAADAADFARCIAALHRVVHAIDLYLGQALNLEVTQAEAIVLWHLAQVRHEATIGAVHRAFRHRRSTLTSVVDRLQSKGLVERRAGEADRRSFIVKTTPKGRAVARRILRAMLHLKAQAAPASSQWATVAHALDGLAASAASLTGLE